MPLSFQKLELPALADSLPFGIYTCDTAGTLIQFNRQCETIWGAKPRPGSEGNSGGAHRLYDIENRSLAPAETPMAEAVRTGKPAPACELIVERPDGSRVVVQACAEPIFGDDGEIVGGVNCLHEISARNQIELGLARERQILDAIIEATPDCIKIVARDGTLLQIILPGFG